MSRARARATSLVPGSLTPGVPASVTKATSRPLSNSASTASARSASAKAGRLFSRGLLEKDGESVPATTPVDVEFDSYGTFEIQLRHPDRRSESRLVPVSAPLYDYPPLDLVLGFLWPWTISDAHLVEFTLEPLLEFSEEEKDAMIERLESTRARLQPPGEH